MVTTNEMRSQFNRIMTRYGTSCNIRYWAVGSSFYSTSDYDEETLAAGSSSNISGLIVIQPIGAGDLQYLEQGKIQRDDVKGFIAGSINFLANARVTIGNTGSVYDIIPDYIRRWDMSGTTIYHEVFLRSRPTQTSVVTV